MLLILLTTLLSGVGPGVTAISGFVAMPDGPVVIDPSPTCCVFSHIEHQRRGALQFDPPPTTEEHEHTCSDGSTVTCTITTTKTGVWSWQWRKRNVYVPGPECPPGHRCPPGPWANVGPPVIEVDTTTITHSTTECGETDPEDGCCIVSTVTIERDSVNDRTPVETSVDDASNCPDGEIVRTITKTYFEDVTTTTTTTYVASDDCPGHDCPDDVAVETSRQETYKQVRFEFLPCP